MLSDITLNRASTVFIYCLNRVALAAPPIVPMAPALAVLHLMFAGYPGAAVDETDVVVGVDQAGCDHRIFAGDGHGVGGAVRTITACALNGATGIDVN
mgnify:CR=1 FL=1